MKEKFEKLLDLMMKDIDWIHSQIIELKFVILNEENMSVLTSKSITAWSKKS